MTNDDVLNAYERHHARWTDGMTALGLDPTSDADKARLPAGWWFSIQEELRRDLAAISGSAAPLPPRPRHNVARRTVIATSTATDRETITQLEADLTRLMGHQ